MEDENQTTTQKQTHSSPFDAIRELNEYGHEYWSARKLSKILTYDEYRNFQKVVNKAIKSCESAGEAASNHFVEVTDMIVVGKGAKRRRTDYHLTRYACYIIVENADPEKPVVALGQAYFAYQTRRQELSDEEALAGLTEDQRRLLIREQLSLHNRQLAETAHSAGVITARDFAIFQDFGYKGLYGGLSAQAIHTRICTFSAVKKINSEALPAKRRDGREEGRMSTSSPMNTPEIIQAITPLIDASR